MVAVPRKAVGMMLGAKRRGSEGFGGGWGGIVGRTGSVWQLEVADGVWGGSPLPGVDGDAHLQEGSQIDAWEDRSGCHQSHSGGLHPAPLQDFGVPWDGGVVPVPTYP